MRAARLSRGAALRTMPRRARPAWERGWQEPASAPPQGLASLQLHPKSWDLPGEPPEARTAVS